MTAFSLHPERSSLRGIKAPLLWWPLGSLLLVWGLLYLPHLRESPARYGDETGTLLIGRELVRGQSAVGSNVEKLVEKISSEKWPVVWSGKYYLILGNPKFLR